jgi:hypothetical protein
MIAKRSLLRLAVVSSVAVLQACGGGGGGDETPPPPPVTDTTPPTAPGTPTDAGTWSASTSLHFAWTAATDAGGLATAPYQLQIATATDGTGVIYDAPATAALSADLTSANGIADGQTIYARVRAIDAAGNATWSAWSDGITVDATPPSAPGTPTDAGAWSTSTTVAFSWTGSTDAGSGLASYWLTVTTGAGGTGTVLYDGTNGLLTTRNVTVADGQAAYARVKAIDAAGGETWSTGWSDGITVDTSGPVASAPTDAGVWSTSQTLHFAWAAADDGTAGSGVASYTLQVATATDGTGILFDGSKGTGLSHDQAAAEGSTVYARVRAIDSQGNTGAWSTWSNGIQVDSQVPVLSGVTDAGAWSGSTVSLSWSAATDPAPSSGLVANYTLQVSTTQSEAGLVESFANGPGTSTGYYATSTVSWPENGYLYARVGASDVAGNTGWGSWSDGVRIDRTGPSAPGTPTDAGAWSTSTTVTFSWAGSTDAGSGLASYALRVTTGAGGTGTVLFDGTNGLATSRDVTVANGQSAYAQVRAIDAAGNETASGWSNGITVDTTPPGAPTGLGLVSTIGNWIKDSATFSWTSGSDAGSGWSRDEVQLSSNTDDLGGGVVATLDGSGSATFNTDWAPHDSTYYARVRTFDAAGLPSAWSGWSPAVRVDRVGPVFVGAPTDDGVWSNVMLTFDFTAASDAGCGLVGPYTVILSSLGEWDPIYEYGSVDVAAPPAVASASVLGIGDAQQVFARATIADALGNVGTSSWSNGITTDLSSPDQPAAPTDAGAYSTTALVQASWTFAADMWSGTASYRLQAATNTSGTSGIFYDANEGNVFGASVPATEGETVYFRVQAIDAVGNTSLWSDFSDGVLVDLTSAPVAAAPTPDVTLTRNNVLFSWTGVVDPVSGTTGYRLQVSSTTADDGSGVYSDVSPTAAQTSWGFDLSTRPDGSQVYARVAAVDGAGNQSAWTAWSAGVTVDTSGPVFAADPTDVGPFSDGAYTQLPLHIYWADPADPSGVVTTDYLVEVSIDRMNAWAYFSGAHSGDALAVPPAPDGTVFYARVTATDTLGNSTRTDWSDGVAFDGSPPSTPAAPSDPGVRQRELDVLFTWGPSIDGLSGVKEYTIQVKDELDAIVDVATVTGTSYLFTGANGKSYFAHVLASDNLGNSSIYGDWSNGIIIDTSAPGTPGVPNDGAQFTSSATLAFSWAPAADAVSYEIELGAGPDHTVIVGACADPGGATSTTCDVSGEPNGTTFYARVRATDGVSPGGWSDWSDGILLDETPPSAPGTPVDNGAFDDGQVRFDWAEAADAESGVATYEAEVFANGIYFGTSFGPFPFASFNASMYPGATITCQVRAHNGAGLTSGWSPLSDGVVVELNPPSIYWSSPSDGNTMVGRNTDLVVHFSEPMNVASVEGAISLAWAGGGSPAHGLVFFWDATSTSVTVVPDSADPIGITNVDLLPESIEVALTVGTGATDVAGNHLTDPYVAAFTTAEERAPAVASLSVGGFASPVPAAEVVGPFTIVVTFDEEMSPTRGGIRLETPNGGYEQRYSDWWANITGAVSGGGQVTYTTSGCPGIQTGDRVTVQWANPASFDVARAPVLTTGSDGMGNCTFTVAHSPVGSWTNGGQVAYPLHGDASIAWTGPTTLELTLPPWISLAAGSESTVFVTNASDLAGNWTWSEESLQVRSAGGDASPPVLLSSIPLDGAVGVTRVNPVILRFDEPLDRGSLEGIYAVDADGHAWDMTYSSDEMGPVLLFVPPAGPQTGSRVDVHVPATVRDLANNVLGSPIDLSFDVAPQSDFFGPELFETVPTDGDPVDEIYRASAIFADADTGMLERLDSTSVGPEDVLVVDFASGLPLRGFRLRNERGSGALDVESPPRGPGFSTGWGNSGFSSATATAGVATFTTYGPHGLQPGWRVNVQISMGDGCFSTGGSDSPVLDVPTADTFTLSTFCGDGATASSGSLNWRTPRTFVVTLAVPPAAGGTGILDFDGNEMAESSFTVAMTPPGSNRVPQADSLRDIRLGVTTSPSGRQLGANLRVRDPDNDPVTVTLTALGGMPLTGTTQLLTNTSWGAEYRYGGDGPPSGVNPPELDETNFPSSGFYPFEVTLDDGNGGVTTYVREVWVWAAADVPAVESIDDGGVIRLVDAGAPIVVQNTDRPTLTWNNVDTANADFLGLQYIELTAAAVGGNSRGPATLLLDPSLTSAPFPIVAEPTIYAWFATQMKFSPGEMNPESQGWSIDFNNMFESTFVYGPANGTFAGSTYAAGRTAFVTDGAGGFADASVASGTYGVLPSVGAPVFLGESYLVNGDAAPTNGTELFAADALGRFMITTTDPMMGLPLANKGFIGRAGQFFGIVSQSQSAIGLELGVRRDQVAGFGTSLAGRSLAFVQFQSRFDGMSGLQTEASVGVAVADPLFLTVTGTRSDGTPLDVGGLLPYTITDDGLLSLNIGSTVAGLLGGTAGSYMGALAEQDTAANDFFLLVAEKYDGWLGTEDESFITGTYRFVEYTQGNDGAGGLGDVHASYGTIAFDGFGGATYSVFSSFGSMTGLGTYAVDPVAGTVFFTADPGTPNEMDFLFQVAPDADTLLGTSISSATSPQVIILSK